LFGSSWYTCRAMSVHELTRWSAIGIEYDP